MDRLRTYARCALTDAAQLKRRVQRSACPVSSRHATWSGFLADACAGRSIASTCSSCDALAWRRMDRVTGRPGWRRGLPKATIQHVSLLLQRMHSRRALHCAVYAVKKRAVRKRDISTPEDADLSVGARGVADCAEQDREEEWRDESHSQSS